MEFLIGDKVVWNGKTDSTFINKEGYWLEVELGGNKTYVISEFNYLLPLLKVEGLPDWYDMTWFKKVPDWYDMTWFKKVPDYKLGESYYSGNTKEELELSERNNIRNTLIGYDPNHEYPFILCCEDYNVEETMIMCKRKKFVKKVPPYAPFKEPKLEWLKEKTQLVNKSTYEVVTIKSFLFNENKWKLEFTDGFEINLDSAFNYYTFKDFKPFGESKKD